MLARVAHCRMSSERVPDQDRTIPADMFDEGVEIGGVSGQRVVEDRGPLTIAVAAQIECVAVEVAGEFGAHEVPGVRAEPSSMEKDDLGFAVGAPIDIVQPHPLHDDVMVSGHHDTGQVDGTERSITELVPADFAAPQLASPAAQCSVEKASATEVYWKSMRPATQTGEHQLGLGQLLVRLLYHARREAAVEAARLGYPDIRSSHIHVLAHLPRSGIRLTDLAERAHLSLAAASEFVSELEQLGYLERLPDRRDGRAKVILPTKKGRKAFREGRRRAAVIERRWAALVDRDRFEQACNLLQELLDKLDDSEAGAGADRPRQLENAAAG